MSLAALLPTAASACGCCAQARAGRPGGCLASSFNGMALDAPPFALLERPGDPPPLELEIGPRIGISKAIELPWRFGEKGSRFLSKPFRQSSSGADGSGGA